MLPISRTSAGTHAYHAPLHGGGAGSRDSVVSTASNPRRRIRRQSSGAGATFSTYLRRMLSIPQMDFELALWQMAYLVISPRRVYRNVYYNKQTKNHWARDDPAFHIIIALCMCVAAIAYGIAKSVTFLGTLRLIAYTVFVEFLGAGLVIATTAWFVTNQFMLQQQIHAVDQSVEWMYAFDVHCNAFVPFFLVTYVVQFFFLSIVLSDGFICRLLANTIYLVAFVYYWYITFLGYNGKRRAVVYNPAALPFLKNTIAFLYPIGLTLVLYFVSIFTFNASKAIFSLYYE
ncbi:hypothetical protein HK105_201456 [Polyrhizophydium stewartii]|uniref:Uncharacterized protein n=1 Tax=Polyrhizophydium stewartii TaxID=2732419 RepID=A0ABR4NI48_9FUNG